MLEINVNIKAKTFEDLSQELIQISKTIKNRIRFNDDVYLDGSGSFRFAIIGKEE